MAKRRYHRKSKTLSDKELAIKGGKAFLTGIHKLSESIKNRQENQLLRLQRQLENVSKRKELIEHRKLLRKQIINAKKELITTKRHEQEAKVLKRTGIEVL